MPRAWLLARTLPRLGLRNVAAVARHRVGERLGLYGKPVPALLPAGPLFSPAAAGPPPLVGDAGATLARARRIAAGELEIFGDRWVELGSPYHWDENVLGGGDVKGVWEASRFGWAVDLARAHRLSPLEGFLEHLEAYVADWIARHPPYVGANWACGQETAIRLLHLLLANFVLSGSASLTPRLAALAKLHCARIARTLGYAVAQDNNHATSEAAALFAGGSVLGDPGWRDLGRRTLERLAARLILPDGGFAQYSANYHRLLLDTLSQVEFWRRTSCEPEFSSAFRARCRAAVGWLGALVNSENGRVPLLGHNDGAHVYRMSDAPFDDYRPSLSLAAALFCDTAPRDPKPLRWLGLDPPAKAKAITAKTDRLFRDWGLALLNARENGTGAYAFLRYPVRRFRPHQADMLHFDLWTQDGRNLLIDSGTYSYADPEGQLDFWSVRGHNSIAFDGGEPMRRLGRFLNADWPDAEADGAIGREDGTAVFSAGYRDYRGNGHRRTVRVAPDKWIIEDHISGYRDKATIRWHFPEQTFTLAGSRLETDTMVLTLSPETDARVLPCAVSRTYGQKEPALLLAADFPAGTDLLTTCIEIKT